MVILSFMFDFSILTNLEDKSSWDSWLVTAIAEMITKAIAIFLLISTTPDFNKEK